MKTKILFFFTFIFGLALVLSIQEKPALAAMCTTMSADFSKTTLPGDWTYWNNFGHDDTGVSIKEGKLFLSAMNLAKGAGIQTTSTVSGDFTISMKVHSFFASVYRPKSYADVSLGFENGQTNRLLIRWIKDTNGSGIGLVQVKNGIGADNKVLLPIDPAQKDVTLTLVRQGTILSGYVSYDNVVEKLNGLENVYSGEGKVVAYTWPSEAPNTAQETSHIGAVINSVDINCTVVQPTVKMIATATPTPTQQDTTTTKDTSVISNEVILGTVIALGIINFLICVGVLLRKKN